MPKYKITTPDGKAYIVTAPDGATQDQVLAYAQQHHAAQPAAQDDGETTLSDLITGNVHHRRSFGEDLGRAAIMTGRNVVQGAAAPFELLHDAVIRAPVNAISKAIGSDYRMAPAQQQLDANLNSVGIPNPQPENAVERIGSGIERAVSGAGGFVKGAKVLSEAAGPIASRIGSALASNPNAQLAAAAGGSGASELTREAGGSPAAQLGAGLAGAFTPAGLEGIASGTTSTLRRLMASPDAETVGLAQKAAQQGIRLTAPQVSPSKTAKLLDSVTGHIPLSSAGKVQAEQQAQFNQAVGRTFGADSPKLTPDVFRNAKQRLGLEFDRLTSRNDLKVTPELTAKLQTVADDAASFGDDATHNAVMSAIKRVKDQSVNGQLPGRAYQSLDSMLGKISKAGGEKAHYLGEVREALRDAMDTSISPADRSAWTAVRRQYANLKTVEPLVAKSPNGDISAAALMGRVTSNAPGKIAMAQGGRGELGDLARIGQQFLKQKIPDSGTARRIAVLDALKGLGGVATGYGAGVAPLATLGVAGGMVGSARTIQRLLQSRRLLDALTEQPQNQGVLQQRLLQSANPATQTLLQQRQ